MIERSFCERKKERERESTKINIIQQDVYDI